MSWAKADDRYDDTSKIKRAWRLSGYAVGLHWMAVTSCARHESDGLVDPEWLAERLGVIPPKAAATAIETLVALGLFDVLAAGESKTVVDRHGNRIVIGPVAEDSYVVHDYLEFQDSAQTLAARRVEERLRKAISARAKELGMSISDYRKSVQFRQDFPPDSERKPPGIQGASGDPDPTRPDPTRPSSPQPPQAGEPVTGSPASPEIPKNSRAHGTNPRARDERHLQAVADERAALAVASFAQPSDADREGWERLHTALHQAVGDNALFVGYVSEMSVVGVDGSVLVIDAATDMAHRWACDRFRGAVAQWAESLGVPARLATDDERAGLVAA